MEAKSPPGVADYEETIRLLRQQADSRELQALRERDEFRARLETAQYQIERLTQMLLDEGYSLTHIVQELGD